MHTHTHTHTQAGAHLTLSPVALDSCTQRLPHLGARAVCAGPVLRHADACGKMCRVGQNHVYTVYT